MLLIDETLERQALSEALGGAKDLTIDFLDAPVTLERIEAALRQGYHVLHFLGHGAIAHMAHIAAPRVRHKAQGLQGSPLALCENFGRGPRANDLGNPVRIQ